ncbi:MAG: hypothetical protein H8K03_00355 [Nitrospira sp.]|jgi:hypothetical protein|nr:hypothetical protein [Nitrospira sp. BO4]
MFTDIAVGTPVTIVLNDMGEVIDVHVDSKSDASRNGLHDPEKDSALKDFRHLGSPE